MFSTINKYYNCLKLCYQMIRHSDTQITINNPKHIRCLFMKSPDDIKYVQNTEQRMRYFDLFINDDKYDGPGMLTIRDNHVELLVHADYDVNGTDMKKWTYLFDKVYKFEYLDDELIDFKHAQFPSCKHLRIRAKYFTAETMCTFPGLRVLEIFD